MLVLSRKKDESIIINDHIRVTIVEIRGDKVRLGIDAPKDVSVHRREVYEAIQTRTRIAAIPSPPNRASDRSRSTARALIRRSGPRASAFHCAPQARTSTRFGSERPGNRARSVHVASGVEGSARGMSVMLKEWRRS